MELVLKIALGIALVPFALFTVVFAFFVLAWALAFLLPVLPLVLFFGILSFLLPEYSELFSRLGAACLFFYIGTSFLCCSEKRKK